MEEHGPNAADYEELPELSERRLIDLLEQRDPQLLTAVARLTQSLKSESTLTSGWDSAIGVE